MSPKSPFFIYVASLFLTFVATVVLFLTGHEKAASVVGQVGTLVIVIAMFVNVVVTDPLRRFPNASLWRRFVNVITFKH